VLSEDEIIGAIEAFRARSASRAWLVREREPSDVWNAARPVLELRHLLEAVGGGWRWAPDELLLRDYYANSLVPYEEARVKSEE
jgi:hypothetical protein